MPQESKQKPFSKSTDNLWVVLPLAFIALLAGGGDVPKKQIHRKPKRAKLPPPPVPLN
jgi:hypothetical protein